MQRVKTIQPVKQFNQHFQSPLLTRPHCIAHGRPHFFLIRIILELEILPLECNGVVEDELGCAFEHLWDSVLGEVPMEGARNIRKHEGDVISQCFGEDCGESGECVVRADSDTLDRAIGKDENSVDGVDVLLNLSGNIPLMERVLLETASVGQPRRIKDTNLGMIL